MKITSFKQIDALYLRGVNICKGCERENYASCNKEHFCTCNKQLKKHN